MIILVTGGRDFTDSELLFAKLDELHARTPITLVIEGGQRTKDKVTKKIIGGADYWAAQWAGMRGIRYRTVRADWNDLTTPPVKVATRPDGSRYNLLAGFSRNQRMVDLGPDRCVSTPGGKGTADCVARARAAGIEVVEIAP